MKVILLQDIKNVGKKGDVVNVAEGYARNFLIPKKMVAEASTGKLKDLATQKSIEDKKRQKIEENARELASRLKGLTVKIATKVGDGGKLFGAVSNKDISDALDNQHKIKIDKKKIVLKEPIKLLGQHPITIKLHPAVQAEINVAVVAE